MVADCCQKRSEHLSPDLTISATDSDKLLYLDVWLSCRIKPRVSGVRLQTYRDAKDLLHNATVLAW